MKEFEITWDELKVGDIFEDSSKVLSIEPWEYRPCYELKIGDETLVVSDEHLLKCYYIDNKLGSIIKSKSDIVQTILVDNNIVKEKSVLEDWATAKDIFEKSKLYDVIMMLPDYDIELDSIELYKNGEPQKCRCITTNTGHYQIGSFMNHNTTTLASCINDFTQPGKPLDNNMIITLEDPIEYIYDNTNTMRIVQKELGRDFKSYDLGIKQALREMPTMILCGEIRDTESINMCIEASRTGHKVVTSFHSDDCAGTISRLCYHLPDTEGAIYDLISNLDLILCQRLKSSNNTFILETQYIYFTDSIKYNLKQAVMNKENIPNFIENIIKDPHLISAGVVKDWS